jgi:hypothetical protein
MPDSKPVRGRPKEEFVQAFASGLLMSQRKAKESICGNMFVSLIGPQVFNELPRKVLIELGRHVWVDPELSDRVILIATAGTEQAKNEQRKAIFQEYPWLQRFYEEALALKKQGWGADAIVTLFRQQRLTATYTRARSTWEERYNAAVDAIYQLAQRRAIELLEPGVKIKDLARRLLKDAVAGLPQSSAAADADRADKERGG